MAITHGSLPAGRATKAQVTALAHTGDGAGVATCAGTGQAIAFTETPTMKGATLQETGGAVVAHWTPTSADYQHTLNLAAPASERRVKLAFWTKPIGAANNNRALSIEAHGVSDQYSAAQHVTFYSPDTAGVDQHVIEWHWGSEWTSTIKLGVSNLSLGANLPANAQTLLSLVGGSTVEQEVMIQFAGIGGSPHWQIRKPSTNTFILQDKSNDTQRLVFTPSGGSVYQVGGAASKHTFKTSAGAVIVSIPGAGIAEYANNAAALAAGLVAGDLYRTGDALMVVHA